MSYRRALRLTSFPFDHGSSIEGARHGPGMLLTHQLSSRLRALNFQISDVTLPQTSISIDDQTSNTNLNKCQAVSAVTRSLAHEVHDAIRANQIPLTLGGDHSLALGSISGAAKAVQEVHKKELAVLYIDAHADINTPATSPSGNIHGMPLAFATGLATAPAFNWLKQYHNIRPNNLIYIGLRDLDQSEKEIIRNNAILAFDMHDVEHLGIRSVMDKAFEHLSADQPIYMSFDVDALDPLYAPSVTLPVDGGLTFREGRYIAQRVHESGRLVGLEFVEINPTTYPEGVEKTANTTIEIICAALGQQLK